MTKRIEQEDVSCLLSGMEELKSSEDITHLQNALRVLPNVGNYTIPSTVEARNNFESELRGALGNMAQRLNDKIHVLAKKVQFGSKKK